MGLENQDEKFLSYILAILDKEWFGKVIKYICDDCVEKTIYLQTQGDEKKYICKHYAYEELLQ